MSNSQRKIRLAAVFLLILYSVISLSYHYLNGDYGATFTSLEDANLYLEDNFDVKINLPSNYYIIRVYAVKNIFKRDSFRYLTLNLYNNDEDLNITCVNEDDIFASFIRPGFNKNLKETNFESVTRITKGNISYYIISYNIDSMDYTVLEYISSNGLISTGVNNS